MAIAMTKENGQKLGSMMRAAVAEATKAANQTSKPEPQPETNWIDQRRNGIHAAHEDRLRCHGRSRHNRCD